MCFPQDPIAIPMGKGQYVYILINKPQPIPLWYGDSEELFCGLTKSVWRF